MKIRDILAKKEPTLSFEVFPPKTEDKYESVEMAASEIAKLNPAFMSVTYGAGGGTSQYTVDIAASLKAKGVTPVSASDLRFIHQRKGTFGSGAVKGRGN